MTTITPKHHILVVEDEEVTRARIVAYFEAAGYRVSQSSDGEDLDQIVGKANVDVVLLDINLPSKDGLVLARELSEKTDAGIILVTARSDELDRIVGLEIGADDYVTKPFNPRELLARVKNVIRRVGVAKHDSARPRPKSFSGWTLDALRRRIVADSGESIELTRGELELLAAFLDHPGETLSREHLMSRITHRSWTPNQRTVDVLVRRLRQKIEPDPREPTVIVTVYGEGYLFSSDVY